MSAHGYAVTHQEFEALAERLLVAVASKGSGYTPPENAHMLVDTALALAEDLAAKLKLRAQRKAKDATKAKDAKPQTQARALRRTMPGFP